MSDYDSSDSELNRAIGLSLQDIDIAPVIDLLPDDDEDGSDVPDWKRRKVAESAHIRMSSCDTSHSSRAVKAETDDNTAASLQGPLPRPSCTSGYIEMEHGLSGITAVDRKRMEEERLARSRKRKAVSISPPPLSRQATKSQSILIGSATASQETDWHSTILPPLESLAPSDTMTLPEIGIGLRKDAQELSLHGEANNDASLPQVLSYKQQQNLLASGLHFPDGAVRKTWVNGCPRQDDIKIEEVLQKDDLELAVLSAFQFDDEWILRKIDLRQTKVICVLQAETEQKKSQIRANAPPNIRFCFPSMDGQINCMHSKLQLLSHPTHLRIVVPSANLVPYDWGEEGGVMENTVFIIDLARLPNTQKVARDEITPFGRELLRFLGAMRLEESVRDSLLNFDFSRTSHLAFIHSIGGSHTGAYWMRTGYCGLGSAIQELGLATKHAVEIDIVSASVGSLSKDFLKSIYLAAQGDNGTTELNWRTNRPPQNKTTGRQPRGQMSNTELLTTNGIENDFRLYFPSHETVATSKGGIGAGGTICFQSRWFDLPTFPHSIMRDCRSRRPGLLMHNKMIFVRPRKALRNCDSRGARECVAWAYVGSANLSESAWGRLVRDRTTKQPKLNIRNWECGVVIPVLTQGRGSDRKVDGKGKEVDKTSIEDEVGPPGMDVFDNIVPVPMVVPGENYGSRRPWFYNE